MTRNFLTLAMAVAVTGAAACKKDTSTATAPQTAAPAEERLVVIGAGLAEAVVALDLTDRVVAVDRTAHTIAAFAGIPDVGMPQGLAAEGILGLKPTAVLLGEDAGPDAVLTQLKEAGVAVETWTTPYTIDGALGRITRLGERFKVSDKATTVVDALRAGVAALPAVAPGKRGKALFLYARGHRAIYAAGANTAADAVLRLAGFDNAFADVDGMKPVDAEALAARRPATIIVPKKSLDSLGGAAGLAALPGIGDLTGRKVLAVDDLALLGFGPGLVDALTTLHASGAAE